MSKRMVDLKVAGGKVTAINGNEVGGGTAVEANPQEEATQQLEKIKIDNIAYNIAGGGGSESTLSLYQYSTTSNTIQIKAGTYTKGQQLASAPVILSDTDHGFSKIICAVNFSVGTPDGDYMFPKINNVLLNTYVYPSVESGTNRKRYDIRIYTTDALTVDKAINTRLSYQIIGYK